MQHHGQAGVSPMPTATATRPARTAPIGSGHLHNVLEDARDRAQLAAFCAGVGCTLADASSDGVHVDMLRVFEVMRRRGYSVSQPTRPQAQQHTNVTTWLASVTLPAGGPSFVLGFSTPNTS
jgi:hypothetical protein